MLWLRRPSIFNVLKTENKRKSFFLITTKTAWTRLCNLAGIEWELPKYDALELILIYFLTAIELTAGGSSTVHSYTQTIHRITQSTQIIHMRGAEKFLARPTSRCRRTKSKVSLERGVCSCAELQVFSCYRCWKEACQVTRAISTRRRELSSSFFFCKGRRRRKFTPFWKKH